MTLISHKKWQSLSLQTKYRCNLANQASQFNMKVNFAYFLFLLLTSLPTMAAEPASVPSVSTIARLATEVVQEKITLPKDAKLIITPQSLDTRLSPPACLGMPKAEIASDRAISKNNTVKISCSSPELDYPWQIFISVRVEILFPVVVANQTLGPGELIEADQIRLDYVEQSQLRGQQFDDPASVAGTRVKRRIPINQPLFSSNLCFVCKGDSVAIFARSENFEIKTNGEALNDGNLGDRIQVRNSRSHKSVDAHVIGIGEVEVRM